MAVVEEESPFVDGEIEESSSPPCEVLPRQARLARGLPRRRAGEERWPVMTYVSSTLPGVARGPHEHVDQTDGFAFIGPSDFRLYLWDTRATSPTRGRRMIVTVGVKPRRRLDSSGCRACLPQRGRGSRAGSPTPPTAFMRAGGRRNPLTRSATKRPIRASSPWTEGSSCPVPAARQREGPAMAQN